MGLFSKRNLDKAKALAEKNAAKLAKGVDKATDVVDKKTGGKYSDKLKKVDDAAHKFAGQDDAAAATTDTAGAETGTDTTGKPESA